MDWIRFRWGREPRRPGAGPAVIAGVLWLAVAGCALPEDDAGEQAACDPGETLACGCLDGRTGAATCGPSGLFGACDCAGDPGEACWPGTTAACACEGGGTGVQACGDDHRLGTCECDSVTDGGQDGGSDAGTDGGSDAGTDGGTGDGWPASAAEYPFGPTSYTDTVSFPAPDPGSGEATCCRDFDGDASPDNAWAAFAANLAGLAQVDVNADLAAAIAAGRLVLLWDHYGFEPAGGGLLLAVFPGAFDTGTDYAAASAGTGSFLVPPEGFVAGTGEPAQWIEGFWDGTDRLDALGDHLDLAVPLAGGLLPISLQDVEVGATGALEAGPAVSYGSGVLTGWTPATSVLASLDAWAGQACGCLGVSPLFYEDGGTWQAACSATASQDCAAGEPLCVLLGGTSEGGGLCESMTALVLGQYPDVDTDDDGTADAWSFGLEWTAVPVGGVVAAP